MSPFYRNRATGIVQAHPKSGIGNSLNSDEIGQDGKPVKPFVALPITPEKIGKAKGLMRGGAATAPVESTDTTTEAKTGTGDSKQEGDQ